MPVQIQYGGSQTLLAGIEVTRRGDLYIPADDSYVQTGPRQGPDRRDHPAGPHDAGARGPAGQPQEPADARRPAPARRPRRPGRTRTPPRSARSPATRSRKTGQWDALNGRTAVFKTTVNDVANDVQVGAVDAGIVWDGTVRQTPGAGGRPAAASSPGCGPTSRRPSSATPTRPTAALQFARFLAARDRGLPQFAAHGFDPVEGDAWAEEPELKLLAGAMLRPAVEETITAFEQREGVKVTRVYNGCGILVAQMKAGERPGRLLRLRQVVHGRGRRPVHRPPTTSRPTSSSSSSTRATRTASRR